MVFFRMYKKQRFFKNTYFSDMTYLPKCQIRRIPEIRVFGENDQKWWS